MNDPRSIVNWFVDNAPKGTSIYCFYHENPDPESERAERKVLTCCLFQSIDKKVEHNLLNMTLSELGIGSLDKNLHLVLKVRGPAARYIAETLGEMAWNDPKAYRWIQM